MILPFLISNLLYANTRKPFPSVDEPTPGLPSSIVNPFKSKTIFCVLYVDKTPVSTPTSKPLSTSHNNLIVVASLKVFG